MRRHSIPDEVIDGVGRAAEEARSRAFEAIEKHPRHAANQINVHEGLAVLMEEVGEAARAALHAHFGDPEIAAEGRGRLREELLDVAAVALLMIEKIHREGAKAWETDA